MAGDPGAGGGGFAYSGNVLFPVARSLRVQVDAHRFNTRQPRYRSTTDQNLLGAALLVEGPTGRRVRLLAAGGAGVIAFHERTGEGVVWREGTVAALYAEFGTVVTVTRHALVRVDGVFWAGEETGAAGVRFAAGYRF